MTFAPFGDDDLPPVITDEERHDVTARARKALETLNCDRDDVLRNFARYSLTDGDVATLVALAYRSVARQSGRHRAIAHRYLTVSAVAANRRS